MSYWELTHEPNIITKELLDKALDDLAEMAAQPIHPPPVPQWVHDYIASINTPPDERTTTPCTPNPPS